MVKGDGGVKGDGVLKERKGKRKDESTEVKLFGTCLHL